ncbi:MAG TPA: GNAT family N-acetyltransferase [Ignavibacteria bacterium]|nr:GNAT family N-acetyltransferase [Ignavibacteria bacterium]
MKDIIFNFLKKIDKPEFKLFLNLFSNLPKIKFAVIKISGKALEDHLELIAEDIAFLNKLDIYPIIVHGCGSTLDKRLPESEKIDGIRITKKEDMKVIQSSFKEIADSLKENIIEKGGKAEIVEDLFYCEQLEQYGFVGKIKKIKLSKIKSLIDLNITPIISPLGDSSVGKLNINADNVAKELVKIIEPKKFIFITKTSGILDSKGKLIPFLNLSGNVFENITGGMLLKVKEIKDFLSSGVDYEVVITNPKNLIKELFTIKGGGTYIKYHTINQTSDVNSIDKEKVKWTLEDAFDKTLVEDYFENGIKEVFYEKEYEGVAIINEINGMPYLDKFAVAKSYQGTGLGKSLWDRVIKEYPKLIWRSSADNSINTFYTKLCDGVIKNCEWNFYWKNLSNNEIMSTIDLVIKKKKTLI